MKYLYENEVDRDIVKVVQYGLGPIGKSSARAALAVDMVQLVGAVDIDPDLMHKDLGDVLELSEKLGIEVVRASSRAQTGVRPGTSSRATKMDFRTV